MKTNATLKQQQKELAITLMKKLDIYQPYIDVFEKENIVSYFERYIGFWAYQDKELWNRMSLINIASSGHFAADRSVEEYATRIWNLRKVSTIQ